MFIVVTEWSIAQSTHLPPEFIHFLAYMQELVGLMNRADAPKYNLMKVALAHHRFGWTHPFGNGNSRTVRLLTYFLLIKYGFNVKTSGRVLNPTAVFCNDRERYYSMLAEADTGAVEGLDKWCLYVLTGISAELKKVDKLSNLHFLNSKILYPALEYYKVRGIINETESKIIKRTTSQWYGKTQ